MVSWSMCFVHLSREAQFVERWSVHPAPCDTMMMSMALMRALFVACWSGSLDSCDAPADELYHRY